MFIFRLLLNPSAKCQGPAAKFGFTSLTDDRNLLAGPDEPLPQLICPILDFLSSVIRGGKAKTWFEGNNLTAVISAVFQYAQMTDEDVSIWSRLSSPDMLLTT